MQLRDSHNAIYSRYAAGKLKAIPSYVSAHHLCYMPLKVIECYSLQPCLLVQVRIRELLSLHLPQTSKSQPVCCMYASLCTASRACQNCAFSCYICCPALPCAAPDLIYTCSIFLLVL